MNKKFLGENEWLIKNLFDLARINKPSIIFIDKIDSMYGYWIDDPSGSSRASIISRIKTEFLVQMQGVGVDDDILVLGTTNVPWMLDAAIRKCFEKRIYISLPEEAARKRIFQLHIGNVPANLSSQDLTDLAHGTDGYSGADIGVAVREALMMPVRRVQNTTHFKLISGQAVDGKRRHDLLTPCGPRDPGAMEMNWKQVEGDRLKKPNITNEDFRTALAKSRPSVNADDLKRFEEFTIEFGQEG